MTVRKNYPHPKQGILDIAAYKPGNSTINTHKISKIYKLSSNETPLGTPTGALEAYQNVAKRLATYPDGKVQNLRQAIAKNYQVPMNRIMIGNGSDELLGLLAHTYLSPQDEGIVTEHGFSIYEIQIRAAGAIPVIAKEKNKLIDIYTILNSITERTRVIFIANPSNPTGTYLSIKEIQHLHAALPTHVLLILDGAYAEYVIENDYDAGVDLVSKYDNVVMTRTFSKIYGLAGLRIGWMYAPLHVIDAVNRIRHPFNVNSAAQAAGVAAIEDHQFLQYSIAFNNQWRNWITSALIALGLNITPSVTNFLLINFPDVDGQNAECADSFLKTKGYILRRVSDYGFPNALRLSIGLEEANRGVVAAITNFLKKN